MTSPWSAAGIDFAQWRALTRTYLLMDLRRSGGATRKGGASGRASALPLAGMIAGAGMNSIVIALLVLIVRDPPTAAFAMVAMAGLTVSMLLLVDFTGSVVSAEDYWVVAPRPVSSRTYFAARLAAMLAYVIAFSLLMSLVPALVFLAWHGLGFGGFAGAISGTVLSSVAGAAVIIGVYTYLIAHVPQTRLVRVMSWVHLFASALSMGSFLLVMQGFGNPDVRNFSIDSVPWIWYVPVTWFAALVPTLAGTGGARELLAATASVAITLVLLALSAGRISLEFASRLSEATTTSPEERRRGTLDRIPGFREGEAYAIATLVRAQFRNELRFRLAILGVIPLTFFYLGIGWSEDALADPFSGFTGNTGTPMYMAVAFLPMILHGAMQFSDHWRASWVFFATPADPARLLVASKNFVTVFFLGAYLVLLAAIWSVFYDRVWHAVVHALFVGAGAHMLLQGAVMLSPGLPFAKEPRRGEQSGRLFFLFFVGMVFTSLGPALLPFVYARASWTVTLAAVMLLVTALLERRLQRRARAYARELELA